MRITVKKARVKRMPLICAILALVALPLQPALLANAWQNSSPFDEATRDNIRRIIPAVGVIFARNSIEPPEQYPRLRGSGVIIREDGIIVTNYHVIRHDGDERLYDEIHFSLPSMASSPAGEGYRYRLKVVLTNRQLDLALLKITSDRTGRAIPDSMKFPTVEFGDSRYLKLMDDLIIIGYPGKAGSDVTVNKGMVEGLDTVNEWIKTDARLMRGNSGGAAVNREGRLVGIPSKVVVDTEPARKDGDGAKSVGAVGFLRPSHLVAAMLGRIGESAPVDISGDAPPKQTPPQNAAKPHAKAGGSAVVVRGTVKSAPGGQPIAGARVGLVPIGSKTVTSENLVAWGGTDADGRFELNNRVPPGRYSLKAVAFGYVPLSMDVEITETASRLLLQMRPSR
jgi:S1-C subfamily serine protease